MASRKREPVKPVAEIVLPEPLSLQISHREFELYVFRLVKELGGDLDELTVEHLKSIQGVDGSYIFDVVAKFKLLGLMEILCLFECKHQSRPVERGDVQKLRDQMQSVGAHKAVMVATSGFQDGALQYAKTHGIAAIQILADRMRMLHYSLVSSGPAAIALTWVGYAF